MNIPIICAVNLDSYLMQSPQTFMMELFTTLLPYNMNLGTE